MKRRFLSVLLCVAMTASLLVGCGGKTEETGTTPEVTTEEVSNESVEIQILATSDLHGKFVPFDYALNVESTGGSLAQIATLIKELRTDNTVVIDCGDTIQANSAELFLKDDIHPMIKGLNTIGYDVWVPGNHEFNYGMDTFNKAVAQAEAAVLCGNVFNPDSSAVADNYTIIEKDGIKIGVIGMVTPNITRWDAVNLEGYTVTDPVEETKKIIDEIKDEVDVLVAAEHMGENNEYGLANSGVNDLANACPELDLIIAAHDHKQFADVEVNGVLVVENADSGKSVAQIKLTLEKDADGNYQVADRKAESYATADYAADEELVTALADAHTRAKANAEVVIGTLVNGPLAPENEIAGIPQARLQETSLINLINEVQMYYTDADISASALFIDDANLDNGEIKKCDTALIYKYTNTLYKMQLTGAQLRKWMEWTASYYNTYKEGDLTISFNPEMRGYNYDMFSGIKYEINISKEPGQRIENLTKMDGTPVKDDDIFIAALNNYRAASHLMTYGDVFAEGEELPILLEMDVRGDLGGVRELIADYIANVKGGQLEAPELVGNWKITGCNWDEELHAKAVELINSGVLELKNSESGREINVAPITVDDVNNVK